VHYEYELRELNGDGTWPEDLQRLWDAARQRCEGPRRYGSESDRALSRWLGSDRPRRPLSETWLHTTEGRYE